VEVRKFFGHERAEPVAHEGPEEIATGVAAFYFAAEIGVAFEGDVGAVGESANPVVREIVFEIETRFLNNSASDRFGDDDQRLFSHWAEKILTQRRKGAESPRKFDRWERRIHAVACSTILISSSVKS
jgi:hypothetical protein